MVEPAEAGENEVSALNIKVFLHEQSRNELRAVND